MTTSLAAFSQELSAMITRTSQSVVAVGGRRSAGTGIHWRQGLIVTSCEAIQAGERLTLTPPTSQTADAEVLGSDPTTDVAILSLPEGMDLPVATLGDSQALALGQLVSTVGCSAWRGRSASLFSSLGLVSEIGGPWRSQSGGQIDRYIAVSLSLRRGSAGCPLIDAGGAVAGFNTFGPRRKILTIPVATVERVVEQLQQRGKISRGYLGVGMQLIPLPETVRQQHDLANQAGIMAVSIDPGSAADAAGLLLGDILLAIDGDAVESLQQMQALLGPQSVGQTLTIQLLRGGQLHAVTATVRER